MQVPQQGAVYTLESPWQQAAGRIAQMPISTQQPRKLDVAAATPAFQNPAAHTPAEGNQLEQRELDILALATEMSVGPTDVTNRMGIPSATAYRILDKLQKAGLLMADDNHKGKRLLTQLGLAVLREQV